MTTVSRFTRWHLEWYLRVIDAGHQIKFAPEDAREFMAAFPEEIRQHLVVTREDDEVFVSGNLAPLRPSRDGSSTGVAA